MNFVISENPDIICLQETKLVTVPNMIFKFFFGWKYEVGVYLRAQGTIAEIILT
jgi:exonuclease III